MILKKFLILFLGIALTFSTVGPAQAQTTAIANLADSAAIETIARNTPQYLLGKEETQWSDVSAADLSPTAST